MLDLNKKFLEFYRFNMIINIAFYSSKLLKVTAARNHIYLIAKKNC